MSQADVADLAFPDQLTPVDLARIHAGLPRPAGERYDEGRTASVKL
jgi:hypothetical protein